MSDISINLQTVPLFSPDTLETIVGLPETSLVLLLVLTSVWTSDNQAAVRRVTEFLLANKEISVLVSIIGESSETLTGLTGMSSPFWVIRESMSFDSSVDLPALFVMDWLGGRLPPPSTGIGHLLAAARPPPIIHICRSVSNPFSQLNLEDITTIWKMKCNFIYLQVRDLLFQTRNLRYQDGKRGWEKVLENLSTIRLARCGRGSLGDSVMSLNEWAHNARLSSLLAEINCTFFTQFLDYIRQTVHQEGGVNRLFPRRAVHVTLLYRSRKWELLREDLPLDRASLMALVVEKIPDINPRVTKIFASDTGRQVLEEDVVPVDPSRVTLVLIDQHVRQNQIEPFDDSMTNEQIRADMNAIRERLQTVEEATFFHRDEVVTATGVVRTIEKKSEQDSALQMVPVPRLHEEAILRLRTCHSESYEEALLRVLIDWFADEYYSLLPESIQCADCEKPVRVQTNGGYSLDSTDPSPMKYSWYCSNCQKDVREEVRSLDNVGELMRLRSGMPMDFSKAFALVARALGFEVRIVIGYYGMKSGWWNEVFVNDAWVHVDVSGTRHRQISRPLPHRNPHRTYRGLFNQPRSVPDTRLVAAMGVGNDALSLVTRRYLSSQEALDASNSVYREVDMTWCANVMQNVFASRDPRRTVLSRFHHHAAQMERNWLERRFADGAGDRFQMGQNGSFQEPRIGIVYAQEGEVPDWRVKKPEHRFSTCLADVAADLHVVTVELCWTADHLLTRIKFVYNAEAPIIQPNRDFEEDDTVRSTTRSGSLGSEPSDLLPPGATCEDIHILPSEYISNLHITYDDGNSVITSVIVEKSQSPEVRIIGVYGSRESATLAVDFLGTYRVETPSPGLGRTPPVHSFMDSAFKGSGSF